MQTDKKALPVAVPLFRNLFVIMDPGRDQDDEDVLVSLNRFIRLEILKTLGIVANLAPSAKRARLAKGSLNVLGQKDIPVGIGTSCKQPDDDGLEYQFDVGYLAPTEEVQDGKELIVNTLKAAAPNSIVLLLISGMTDAANALREHGDIFERAVRRVVIMGGVQVDSTTGLPQVDAEGRMLPDMTAQNHSFDKDSTAYLYKELQDRGIPITVVSRHAATAARVPRAVYDEMAATGHVCGQRLLAAQKKAIEELWRRACLPDDHADRHGLPNRCNKEWFCKAFCAGNGTDRQPTDSIWDLVQTFNLYDPATLIAAIPTLREHFYGSAVVEYNGVENFVIGVSADNHNVHNPAELAEFMRQTLVGSLEMSMAEQTLRVA